MPLLRPKNNPIVVGLNSGTSADGLDLAAIRIRLNLRKAFVQFLAGQTVAYPKGLKNRLQETAENEKAIPLEELIRLDRSLGCFYGDEAARFCRNLRRKKMKPEIIASHGHTIRHLPGGVKIRGKKESGSLQLGHPESIAQSTGLTTVADFRQNDIAAGGEGAPITCFAMWLLFNSNRESRLLVNIGGISNFFLLPRGKPAEKMEAADCGPGNSLIDIITRRYYSRKFDSGGKLAARGKISKRLLSMLLSDNFLKGKYGPSTGRERFGPKFAEKIIKAASRLRLDKTDILATTTELTAVSIAHRLKSKISRGKLRQVYLFGGGAKNEFLVNRLKANLPGTDLTTVKKLDVEPDYLEAICYAIMGTMALRSDRAGLPHITGSTRKTISGRIILP